MMSQPEFKQAAQMLLEAHERREPFRPLPENLAPRTGEAAYAIQDAFVALRAKKRGAIVGYKIALASAQMRRFVGVDEPQAGIIFESTVQRTPASVRASDYLRLIVEFEIAVQMAGDLPAADAPYLPERVAQAVGSVMPALELADDRNADYAELRKHPFELIADNTWNEGVVLGYPLAEWQGLDLARVHGIATINGEPVGEGVGGDAMGHPLNSVAWIANHLAAHGRGLLRSDVVITGSIITSKTVKAGDLVRYAVEGLGEAELRVD
jgi:2-keto-4-pentenoate hydratase